jgi:hypothetical protein
MSPLSGANATIRAKASRAFERHIAEMKLHRSRLSDFFDLVEIARGAIPVPETTAKRGAGEQATSDICEITVSLQTFHGLVELIARSAGGVAPRIS